MRPSPGEPRRRQFALTGKSVDLDPRINAVRPDLADVRLAEQVFAPHYAQAVRRSISRDATLRSARGGDAEVVARVNAGESFDLLDIVGDDAWGITDGGTVGYLPADVLAS